MGVLYSKIPEKIKKEVIDPYISIENNEARISLRIKDSEPNLRRKRAALVEKKIELESENFTINNN